MNDKITAKRLERAAHVYIRQSTLHQVRNNQESRRRQYALEDRAREFGFKNVGDGSQAEEDRKRRALELAVERARYALLPRSPDRSRGATACSPHQRFAALQPIPRHLPELFGFGKIES